MSSLLVRGRSRTLGNRSASETDLLSNFRRRSVQSINHFSLRRILRTEPVIHSLRLTSKDAANPTRPAEPLRLPETGGPRRTNRGDVIIPRPFSSSQRSHQDPRYLPAPAIIVLQPTDASGTTGSPPLHHHRDLASTNPVENFSDSLPLRPPLASILKPMFTTPFQFPHSMGNHFSNRLHHHRRKENKSSEFKPDSAKETVRPASSPAPVRSHHPSLLSPIVIPDRRSSISPQLHSTPGNVSAATTIRPKDVIQPPPRSATAPGTKPLGENFLSPLPSHDLKISAPTIPENEAANPPSASPNPLPPRTPGSFPFLTVDLPIRAPALTLAHFACYQTHRRMTFSPNIHNPVPCMTCGVEGGNARWKCQWCCLRICPGCMERLSKMEGRDLAQLMQRLQEEGRRFLGGRKEEWGDGNGQMWDDGQGGEGGEGGGVSTGNGVGVGVEVGKRDERGGDEGESLTTLVVDGAGEAQGKENHHNNHAERSGAGGAGAGSGAGRASWMDTGKTYGRRHGHGHGGHGHGHSHGHEHRHGNGSGHGHGHGRGHEHKGGRDL